MKKFALLLSLAALAASTSMTFAQNAERLYTDGPVVEMVFVRTRPGKFDEYMHYVDKTYKPLMDEAKKAGIVVDWAIYNARPRDLQDADLILTTTYKNMAAFDTLRQRMEPLIKKTYGSLPKAAAGGADRENLRTQIGSQVVRQLILK